MSSPEMMGVTQPPESSFWMELTLRPCLLESEYQDTFWDLLRSIYQTVLAFCLCGFTPWD